MVEDGNRTPPQRPSQRLVTPRVQEEDTPLDRTLRPRRLEEYVGQDQVKQNLRIAIQAAKQRKEALDHTIFYGPPGLGKTTLAYIIAQEMGVNIRVTSGPAIEKPGEMASLLTVLEPYDIFFIDEIHRLSRLVEEVLYPAMEEQRVDVVLPGKGPGSARMLRINLKPFTLVGATTRFAMVSAPLRERFGSIYRLDFYTPKDLEIIVLRSAEKLGIKIEPAGATEIAARSRGTPRIANRLLRRLRDFAQVRGKGVITKAIAEESLASLQVDPQGLDLIDVKLLTSLIEKYGGGPVGLETIAASIGEEADTVMDVYEPYLLQLGFLDRTPKGRVATPLAYHHLGLPDPRAAQQEGRPQQERLL